MEYCLSRGSPLNPLIRTVKSCLLGLIFDILLIMRFSSNSGLRGCKELSPGIDIWYIAYHKGSLRTLLFEAVKSCLLGLIFRILIIMRFSSKSSDQDCKELSLGIDIRNIAYHEVHL